MSSYWSLLRRRRKGLAVVCLLGVALLGLVNLWPERLDLSKYQALADRGELEACRTALYRALDAHPDWHEGRVLLVEVELRAGEYGQATRNLIYLAQAGRETWSLESQMSGHWDPEMKEELERAFDPLWHWPRFTYIRWAVAGGEYLVALTELTVLVDLEVDVRDIETYMLTQAPLQGAASMIVALDGESPWAWGFVHRLLRMHTGSNITLDAFLVLLDQPGLSLLEAAIKFALDSDNLALAWYMLEASGGDLDLIISRLNGLEGKDLQVHLDLLWVAEHPELSVLRGLVGAGAINLELVQNSFSPILKVLLCQD